MASPANSPAATASGHERRSQAAMNTASAAKPKANAGTSSIRLTPGNTAGDSTTMHTTSPATAGANRRKMACSENTSSRFSGSSESFHSAGSSPSQYIAAAIQ